MVRQVTWDAIVPIMTSQKWSFFAALGDLQTSFNDFNYTISTGYYDSNTYWRLSEKCETRKGWPVTYATLAEYEHIRDWVNETDGIL